MSEGVVDPFLELFAGDDGAGRIVWIAEIDDRWSLAGLLVALWKAWDEVILGVAWQVLDACPLAVGHEVTSAATHGVAIDVDRIDRIGHTERVLEAEDIADVAGIALGTVVDEDLVTLEGNATWREVIGDDGVLQERIAMLRTVATEGLAAGHLIDRLVQSLDDGWTQWLCDVADAETDDVGLWMCGLECCYLLRDGGEEVAGRKFEEVIVNVYHIKKTLPLPLHKGGE